MNNNSKYCLVLSGGGAKGVYHVGAWKALKEIDVKVDAFIGNSIGAIIAGFLACGQDKKLEEIVTNIGLDYIVNIPEKFIKNGELTFTNSGLSAFKSFYHNVFGKTGLNTSPLRKLVTDNIDEDKIRESGIDFGVVTYNISKMKPQEIFIEDMETNHLHDYILASSAFPGFEKPEISGMQYIDGGVYDNIPYTMAKQRGYRNLIVIDISGLGFKKKLKVEHGSLVYIKNSIDMGGVLDFSREFLSNYMELGYLDTLRTFERLNGYNYYFETDNSVEEKFQNLLLNSSKIQKDIIELSTILCDNKSEIFHTALKKMFPKHVCYCKNWLPLFIDCAATTLSFKRIRKRSYKETFKEIESSVKRIKQTITDLKGMNILEIQKMIETGINKNKFIKAPYYYFLLIDQNTSGKINSMLKNTLCDFFPELAISHAFISMIESKKISKDFFE